METKFTKGPWSVQSTEKANCPGCFWHEIAADGVVFAEIYESEADEEPRDALADANLIASSPDLYEALKVLLARVLDAWPALRNAEPIKAAEDALAKARGETA